MLGFYIYDTSSFQDRLVQMSMKVQRDHETENSASTSTEGPGPASNR